MKTFQIHWQNRTTGETELIEQGSVGGMDEMSAWVASVKRGLENRYGWQLLVCDSNSEHFVRKREGENMKQAHVKRAIIFKCAYCGGINWGLDSLTHEKNSVYRSDVIMCDKCNKDNLVVDLGGIVEEHVCEKCWMGVCY